MVDAKFSVKLCPTCNVTKPVADFHKDRTTGDGFCTACKVCRRARRLKHYEKFGDQVRAKDLERWRTDPQRMARRQARIDSDKDAHRRYHREYRAKDREKWRAYNREYFQKNAERLRPIYREWVKNERKTNPAFRLAGAMRGRIAQVMNGRGWQKPSKTQDMIGCNWQFLRDHIEKQFREGMSFDNYGEWHVDHIIPLASARTVEGLIPLFHYTNLQPLWAEENQRKSASMPDA